MIVLMQAKGKLAHVKWDERFFTAIGGDLLKDIGQVYDTWYLVLVGVYLYIGPRTYSDH